MEKDVDLMKEIKALLRRYNLLNKRKKSAKRRSKSSKSQLGGSFNNAGGPAQGLGFMIEFFLANPGMIFVFFAATVLIGGCNGK